MFDLLSYKCLEADWDGYGSIKPIPQKISYAWKSLNLMVETKTPIPSVMISASSEIGFYWSRKNSDVYMEVSFYDETEDGTKGDFFGYLIDRGNDNYEGAEDIPISEYRDSSIYKESKKIYSSELEQFDEYYFNLFARKEIDYKSTKEYLEELYIEEIDANDKYIDEYFANKPKKKATKMMPVPSDEAIEVLHGIVNGEPLSADFAEIIQINFMDLLD